MKNKAKEIALEKLAAVGLSHSVAELSPAEVSGGMKRRVALSRADGFDQHEVESEMFAE